MKTLSKAGNRQGCRGHHKRKSLEDLILTAVRYAFSGRKCTVPLCSGFSFRKNIDLCEMHYQRQRRGRDLAAGRWRGKKHYYGEQGYITERNPLHPLATSTGCVLEHRRIYHDEKNEDPKECFWCGAHITWDTLVIDHLDDNKRNNEPANLEAACGDCNLTRGVVRHFSLKTALHQAAVLCGK